jgi:23S rRNA G2445 N2-methylase RlmL
MISFVDENFKKNLKKNIYGKAHITKIIFPPGSGAAALHEAKAILNDLWAAKKFTGEVHLLKNEIQVRPVYMLAITELLLRNHCFSDVRLVIFKEIVIGKKAFDKKSREIRWDYYLNKKMLLKIKVNSVASTAFHETGLKKILTEIIKPHVSDVVSGEGSDETTCLYVEFYKNKLTISISLAGQPLYKRGYRGKLSASAPLKEDAAACCIQTALLFAKKQDKNFLANTVLVPFSGTGTFAFEYCQIYFQLISAFFEREYALKEMPLFRKTHFDLLVNKAKEQSQTNTENIDIICIDKASNAVAALEENIKYCFANYNEYKK